ncbi:MAG: YggS family pyridoxal phosphate-dependent enzyme [Flavobacteriales bacterium]|nr:Pyridoxal phosphate homeostasis protein [Flavobacteriales bacterium]MCC6578601.1 YggS family pyridoxal phosphate-dependent enzyme [Flavobacteriales bacterium]NUQ15970.1 YggS family pyridoxal phosphate-dependent enzyme [Flavobacteriales bacterium]
MSTPLADRYHTVKAALHPGVTLVAVSKTRTVAEIGALYALGQRDFGENYPQELREKAALLPRDIRWHFIGHLQRSNARHVVPLAHLVHGVDSARLATEIDKRAKAEGRIVDVLLQVHIAQEETKHGLSADELREAVRTWSWAAWDGLRVRGLMGMASNTDDRLQVAREFKGLRELFDEIAAAGAPGPGPFDILSMGMSGDADLAMDAGSTLVRIGTALFGPRA